MEELNLLEMRSQIAILKEKIDKEAVINDKMMHEVINSKTDGIKQKQMISVFCGLLVMALAPVSFHMTLATSWYFVFATDVLMLYCIIMELKYKRLLNDKTLMSSSMLEVAQRMSAFKSGYRRYTIINMAVLLPVWFVWLMAEMIYHASDKQFAIIFGTALTIGLIIGCTIGLYLYFRIINTADDIIRQIEE